MSQQVYPFFTLPRAAVISMADRASLAMIRQAGIAFELPHDTFVTETRDHTQAPPPTRSPTPITITLDDRVNDIAREIADRLSYEIDYFGSFSLHARTGLSTIGYLLFEAAFRSQRPFIPEDEYLPLTVQSPIHMLVDRRSRAWIVTNMGILGEPPVSRNRRVGPGSIVRLYDTMLATRYFGFEKPWLFGVVGEVIRREQGFHIFTCKPHVCIYTGEPYPIDINHTTIAIPDIFLYNDVRLAEITHMNSLGQRVIPEFSSAYPPLRPWEHDPIWEHPEWYKIEEWNRGERPDFPEVWSRYLGEQQ
jgi:hypothetical protein